MKKIILYLLIIFVGYIILIFLKPDIADSIEKMIGLNNFNKKVRDIKVNLDKSSLDVPTTEEIEEKYNDVKGKIINLKESIDEIRTQGKEIEETYDKTKEFIEDASEKINKVKEVINKVEEVSNLINSGNTLSGIVE